jgi:ATP synthase protein I
MQPYLTIRRRVMVLTIGLLSVFLIMDILTPFRTFFAGLLLGTFVSLYNFLYLSWKLQLVQESLQTGGRIRGIGMINRFLVVACAILVAVKFSAIIDVQGVIIGLPLCYILSIISNFKPAH